MDADGEYSEKFNIKVIRIILTGFTYLRKPESPNTFLSTLFSTGISQSVYWPGCRLDNFHFAALLSYTNKTDK